MQCHFTEFVNKYLVRAIGQSVEVRWAYVKFIDTLPRGDRVLWKRWRFVGELRNAGFAIVKGPRKVEEIVGWQLAGFKSTSISDAMIAEIKEKVAAIADAPPRMSAAVDEPALVTAIKTETV